MAPEQLNIEYFFRLLYNLLYGENSPITYESLYATLAHVWLWVIVIGYTLSVAGLLVVIYALVRLFELRKREGAYYKTLIASPLTSGAGNPRWKHIESLMNGVSASEWREAITEADIMLEDLLTQKGYTGAGVGEKLKSASRATFHTLDDAWEAHKVRNQIAHEGSLFNLSESLAQRTISRYEAVFREFNAI